METSNLTGKTFKDVVNLVQSGDDTIVQMSLNATTGSWITVATLQDIQASSLTQESFHGLDKIGTIGKTQGVNDNSKPARKKLIKIIKKFLSLSVSTNVSVSDK